MLRGPLVPGRCAGRCHHDGLVGTSTARMARRTSGLPHRCNGPAMMAGQSRAHTGGGPSMPGSPLSAGT